MRRAQALVEFAVVVPVLLLATLGVVQFAFWLHAETVVDTAVAQAARTAALRGGTLSQGVQIGSAVLRDGLGASASQVSLVGSESVAQVQFEARGGMPSVVLPPLHLPLWATLTLAKDRFIP